MTTAAHSGRIPPERATSTDLHLPEHNLHVSLLVAPHLLTNASRKRTSLCGYPLRFIRASGATDDGRFACGSIWCEYCASRKRVHRSSCIASAICGSESPVMVTLTLPQLHHPEPLSAHALRCALERKRELWMDIGKRMRWGAYHRRCGDLDAESVTLPAPSRHGGPHPWYASTFVDGVWSEPDEKWGCVWALEVTQGGASKSKGKRKTRRSGAGHWHVHLHVLVPSREWAERLNAAFQATVQQMGILPVGQWAHTHFLVLESTQGASKYMAKAVASYAGKGGDLDSIHADHHGAYVAGMHNVRRLDAQGEWRPLGLSYREPVSDPATHVLPFADELHDADDLHALAVPIADWWSGKSEAYRAIGAVEAGDADDHHVWQAIERMRTERLSSCRAELEATIHQRWVSDAQAAREASRGPPHGSIPAQEWTQAEITASL